VIRLFDTATWKQLGLTLRGHALTITKIRFSHNDQWLLSVSRDRTWRLWEKDTESYRFVASSKSHSRIIWDCCWGVDDAFFATASRDKTVKVWHVGSASQCNVAATLKFDEAVTAITAGHVSNPMRHVLAVGLENGQIFIYTAQAPDVQNWASSLSLSSE